jgi:ribokinase
VVVIKLDKDGAVIADGEGVRSIPPFHAKVVDTTAAGDAFTAALVVAWSEGRTLKESVTIANAAGALCCERFGAQPSLPGRQSVERLAFGQLASQP